MKSEAIREILVPTIKRGLIEMTVPDKPQSPPKAQALGAVQC